ncbi:MAG TPA: GGDEF domain-containing protein [Gammaproteobacteria bacterium]|jgi:diguanylate cyclase (GGDEF)-like protein
MPTRTTKSKAVTYLLLGCGVFLVLYIASWTLTTIHTSSHIQLMERNEEAAIKMNALASLIEIARERTSLAHKMIQVEDVFEKDALAQQVNAMAADFVIKRRELLALSLSDTSKRIMDAQLSLYPVIIDGFDRVAELAILDTPQANEEAHNILVNQILANQHDVISGFLQIMRNIEQDVVKNSRDMQHQYAIFSQFRNGLGIITLLLSAVVVFVLTKNISGIERRLINLSAIDSLTGVLNRRSFDQILNLEWKRSMRSHQPISLILIDVDHFKPYNDIYGHYEGDRCLHRVAQLLSRKLHREEDIVARYGGEEFAVLLPNVDEDGAQEVAERLRESVYAEDITHERSEAEGFLTISLGVATVVSSLNLDEADLIKAADLALYESKASGRNRVTVFGPEAIAVPQEQVLVKTA